MPIFALYITYPSGYVSVQTFDSAFLRSLEMILLRCQPVALKTVDY